jgi:hypothetical protein
VADVIGNLRAWWAKASLTERILTGTTAIGGILVVALLIVVLGQNSDASEMNDDLGATGIRVVDLGAENEQLVADLATAQQQLTVAEDNIARNTAWTAEQEGILADASDMSDAAAAQAATDLAEAERLVAEAESDMEEAKKLVAELTLAYSEDIAFARATVATAALEIACDWGTSQAVAGKPAAAISGLGALSAFTTSDRFAELNESREIATAIAVAATLGEDRYGVSTDAVEAAAAGCWQKEDVKINAALYTYQDVFREAALDAACTHGRQGAYTDYKRTSIYQSWWLTVGNETEVEYRNSVVDRFGSIEAFVAIPATDIDTESARCEDVRELIEPKSSGTWNVGDEIKPGTWKAYDVSDCYWARLSANGDIRANHFGDGLRLSVNVSSSDGQLEISGCTFYYANP